MFRRTRDSARTDGTRRPSTRRSVALLVGLALTLAACGSSSTVQESGAPVAGASEAEAALLAGEFETLAGTTVDLADFQGEDVVLWFWAPW